MAPEVACVEKKGGYGLECDVWAVGITAVELAECQPPLYDMHPMQVRNALLFSVFDWCPQSVTLSKCFCVFTKNVVSQGFQEKKLFQEKVSVCQVLYYMTKSSYKSPTLKEKAKW